MSHPPAQLALAADFEPATEAQWRALVEKALKGADFDKRLVSRTADDIALQPLYMQAAEGRQVSGKRDGRPWRVAQRLDHPEPQAANALALTDLENGADSLILVTPDAAMAADYGLALTSLADLETALAGVALPMIGLRLEPAPAARRTAALVAALVEKNGLAPSDLTINFGFDPLGAMMTGGTLAASWSDVAKRLSETVADLQGRGFAGPFLNCDVRPVHAAGGSEAQELAVAVALGVAYMRALTDSGHDLTAAPSALSWALAIDADQFLGVAKLRALRLLWARVEEAAGLGPQAIEIHAETAWRMMSRRDPGVNMLRTTMATAAAGIGGADSISVLPFTLPLGLPNAFARRIARNTQTILLEESNLWRVADPAAGSGAYEELTDELCAAAWAQFQEIEREGGLAASLESGALQARIGDKRAARNRDVARRAVPLTGTSEFPNLDEESETVLNVASPVSKIPRQDRKSDQDMAFGAMVTTLAGGATIGDITPPPAAAMTVTALPCERASEPYEALRTAADAFTEKHGQRPRIFLANLGPLAEHGTRATWIRNLLAAGGIEGTTNDGFTNSADAAKAFAGSGASVACICGSDETYGQLAEATASALKAAGAKRVELAGRPGDDEAALKAAGVDGFLHVGIDVVAALDELQGVLDVRA